MNHKTLTGAAQIAPAFFASLLAVVMAVFFFGARRGLPEPFADTTFIVLGCTLLLHIAAALTGSWREGRAARWYLSPACVVIVTLSGMVCAGIVGGGSSFPPLLTAMAGCLFFIMMCVRTLAHTHRSGAIAGNAVFLCLFCCFALWAVSAVWGISTVFGAFSLGYFSPLFAESLFFGQVHLDTLFHCSISSMIQTYGIPSTGLDGLPFLNYHFGSHWMFAHLARFFCIDTVTFYQLAYPVMFVPLYFYSMLLFAQQVRRLVWPAGQGRRLLTVPVFVLFFASGASFLPKPVATVVGLGAGLTSQSCILSLTLVFFLFCVCLDFWRGYCEVRVLRRADIVLLLIVVPAAVAGIGLLKLSSMVLTAAVLIYALLRLRLYRQRWFAICGLLVIVVAAGIVHLTTPRYGKELSFEFLHYLRHFVAPQWRFAYLVLHHVWVLLAVCLTIGIVRIYTPRALAAAVRSGRTLGCEILIVASIVGLLPGAVLEIPGGSAAYFSDFQQRIAVPVVLALASGLVVTRRAVRAGFFLVLATMVCVGLLNVQDQFRGFLAHTVARKKDILAAPPGTFAIADILRGLGELPPEVKRKTALFISQETTAYWGLEKTIGCQAVPFVAPALSGLTMIDGLPSADCGVANDVVLQQNGYGCYELRTRPQTRSDRTAQAVCARALGKGFSEVVRIDRAGERPKVRRVLCAKFCGKGDPKY